MNSDEFYTIAEVAKILKVHEITVRRWAESGKIHTIHFSSQIVRIRWSEIERIASDTNQAILVTE